MNTCATPDHSPIIALLRRRMKQPGIPRERRGNGAPIRQVNAQRVFCDGNALCVGKFDLNRGNIHSMPRSNQIGVRRRASEYGRSPHAGTLRCFAVALDRARTLRDYPRVRRARAEVRHDHWQKRRTDKVRCEERLAFVEYKFTGRTWRGTGLSLDTRPPPRPESGLDSRASRKTSSRILRLRRNGISSAPRLSGVRHGRCAAIRPATAKRPPPCGVTMIISAVSGETPVSARIVEP